MHIERMDAERKELLAHMRYYLHRAEREGRDLTPDEIRDYDEMEKRFDELTEQIEWYRSQPAHVTARQRAHWRAVMGPARVVSIGDDQGAATEDQDAALRAIESRANVLTTKAGDRLVELVRRDHTGHDSRYLAAVADPAYRSAFVKRLMRPDTAHQEFTPEEAQAVSRVGEAMSQRAMAIGTGSAGGFAVPFDLDPTIALTSDGAVNPIRELASVTTITFADEWRGLTSEGVTAQFVPEATEAEDNSPELQQPVIRPERAQCFVPFSIEVGQDWESFTEELARLFAEAKDALEAEKFVSGTGTNEPEGLIAGLAGSSIVKTASPEAFAIDDVYRLQEALPARFQPRATWLASNPVANEAYRFAGPGSDEPGVFNEARDAILGKPYREVSTMDASTATPGQKVLAYGDLAVAYKIVDRIGLTIELVPHLFGPNQRPTGQRGLYAIWRVGAGVVVDNAIRVLEIDQA